MMGGGPSRTLRHLLAVAAPVVAALAIASCAGVDVGGAAGPPAPAPEYRVGDRWVYHAVEGYRAKVEWDETHEVTAIGPAGITVKVTVKGPTIDVERVAPRSTGTRSGSRWLSAVSTRSRWVMPAMYPPLRDRFLGIATWRQCHRSGVRVPSVAPASLSSSLATTV